MKKITFLVVAIVISCSACNKRDCWKCITKQVNEQGIAFSGAAAKFSECDKTEVEIRQLEKDRSGTQTYNNNGKTETSTAVTTCK